jgi:restriction system protein
MLTQNVPATWQDLQIDVATILSQCGFSVELEKVVENVRGRVAIDVYAEETNHGRRNLILCECKHWQSAVPQQIIHGFRTVVSDIGANAGYIIALSGFQTGAFAAIAHTNVKLVTWLEFQSEFEVTWLKQYFTPTITEELDALMSYTEPFAPAWFGKLTDEDKQAYSDLVEAHSSLGILAMQFSKYHRMIRDEAHATLPLRDCDETIEGLPDDVLDATGYADLLQIIVQRGHDVVEQFRDYREKAIGKRVG